MTKKCTTSNGSCKLFPLVKKYRLESTVNVSQLGGSIDVNWAFQMGPLPDNSIVDKMMREGFIDWLYKR